MFTPKIQQIEMSWRDLQNLTLRELYMLRASYTCEQGMLGIIPLIASTIPLIFLVFGSHVTKYLPIHNHLWLLVMVISILGVVWSITHHFRVKGSAACNIYLIDLAIRQKENDSEGVKR